MKILLDYKIDIEVRESNKIKEKLTVFYREFTQAEKKEHDVLKKKFEKIFKKAQKIGKKEASLTKQAELYELNGDYEKALKALASKSNLDDELETLMDELEDIGGEDQEAFAENTAMNRFETIVSGDGKNKLMEYAVIKGYVSIMRDLDVAKKELEKKQSGE